MIGLGPHSSKKKQDLDKLYELKSKARQIMNQFGPSALINLSNFSSIKPEPASTPPQGSMANSTTVVKIPGTPGAGGRLSPENNQVLTKKKLQDLVREVDPNEQLDEDVEEMLLQIADDFIESVVTAACQLARHRKSTTLEVKDVQLHLERQWNMWIPGFGSEEIRPYKKACTTEAHKQVSKCEMSAAFNYSNRHETEDPLPQLPCPVCSRELPPVVLDHPACKPHRMALIRKTTKK
ncbi:Transcription initiation factor TFIID subunit 12 [Galemys pyrenaicus]|uniref:Transcription initiation factor TFIID subunit 12 n=1 Tax=Galemys pyrenaicus TaxID=202257 RepID=A0A8J5ZTN6_GALPY|nr:Transcription initiation factor TFIID subunit 12 [Galemys pyrenaicus]